jgi:hypothetical protein
VTGFLTVLGYDIGEAKNKKSTFWLITLDD